MSLCATLFMQCGIVANFTGNYYPAIRITGMTAGQVVSLDDIEVRLVLAWQAALHDTPGLQDSTGSCHGLALDCTAGPAHCRCPSNLLLCMQAVALDLRHLPLDS